MVVFAEHRYYGSSWQNGSWPFGDDSLSPDKVGFLTVEQALADFADLIRHIKLEVGVSRCCLCLPPDMQLFNRCSGMLQTQLR